MSTVLKSWVVGKWIVADDESNPDEIHYGALLVVDALDDDHLIIQVGNGLKIVDSYYPEKRLFYATQADALSDAAEMNGDVETPAQAAA